MTATLCHAVIARSETTKQSSFLVGAKMDCFARARNDDLNHRKLECPPASWPGSAKRASRNVRAIHVLAFHARKDVDARHKAGHDGELPAPRSHFLLPPPRSVGRDKKENASLVSIPQEGGIRPAMRPERVSHAAVASASEAIHLGPDKKAGLLRRVRSSQ